jgi:hypothetical protein
VISHAADNIYVMPEMWRECISPKAKGENLHEIKYEGLKPC